MTSTDKSGEDPVKVVICGAGPAGLLLAHFLLRSGGDNFKVVIYDKAEDPRETLKQGMSQRRYTIGISVKGENSLKLVPGLLERVKTVTVSPDCCTMLLPFLKSPLLLKTPQSEAKKGWMVDRFSLCSSLLSALLEMHADKIQAGLLQLNFGCGCSSVDLQKQEATFVPQKKEDGPTGTGPEGVTEKYDLLVGADGLRSVVRNAFQTQIRGFEVEQQNLPGTWTVTHFDTPPGYSKTCMHFYPVIPRSGGMGGLAIPSIDGSLCVIVSWRYVDNPEEWLACKTPEEAHEFLSSRLPHLHIPKEAAWQLRSRPVQSSAKIKCGQYHDTSGHAVLIGDAAHATPPSIGQGCNASLVDASILGRLLTGEVVSDGTWAPQVGYAKTTWAESPSPAEVRRKLPDLLAYFSALQVKEGHALVDLSYANDIVSGWAKILHTFIFVLRFLLASLLFFLVYPPTMMYTGVTSTPYSKIYKAFKWETDFFLWANQRAHKRHFAEAAAETLKEKI